MISKLAIGPMDVVKDQLGRAMTMIWSNPLPLDLVVSYDSDSFKNIDFNYKTNLPVLEHVGAFGVKRKHHFHEGVDLYAPEGTVVRAVEDGVIVRVAQFTGEAVDMPWWEDTWAVMIEGESGVVVYGEIIPCSDLYWPHIRSSVKAGDPIGAVKRVLKVDKGRPMSMLHLELRKHGTTDWSGWYEETGRPDNLLDPTPHLLRTSLYSHLGGEQFSYENVSKSFLDRYGQGKK